MKDGIIKRALKTVAAVAEIITHVVADWFKNHTIFGGRRMAVTTVHNENYTLHDKDKEYIQASSRTLIETIGENPVSTLLAMDNAADRLSAVTSLCERLVKLYGCDGIKIDMSNDGLDNKTSGFYAHELNFLHLNTAQLLTDNAEAVADFLDTIFHEFRHAVQWKIVESKASGNSESYEWYNDDSRAKALLESFDNYIPASQNPRAYYYQYVELDAREIAAYILEGVK